MLRQDSALSELIQEGVRVHDSGSRTCSWQEASSCWMSCLLASKPIRSMTLQLCEQVLHSIQV